MDAPSRFVRAPGTASRTTAERAYLFRRGWEEIVVLEGLGVWVWQCLSEPVSAPTLAEDVEAVLGGGDDRIVEELTDLLERLFGNGAVQSVSAARD